MKICFIRHGESKANVWGKMYDEEKMNFLSLRGVKQAELAAYTVAELMPEGIDFVFTSDMNRSRQTASIIMQTLDDWQRKYHIDERLNEWCWQAVSNVNWYEVEPEGDFRTRIDSFFEEQLLPLWNTDTTVMLVSHYYSTVGLFDKIATHQGLVTDYYPLDIHGHVGIPNAIPYFIDTRIDQTPIRYGPGDLSVHR